MIRSLGYVTVPTPGTRVRATVNAAVPATRIGAQAVLFQALPDNTDIIYVGEANMNTSTGIGVLGIIAAPADPTLGPFPSWGATLPVGAAGLNMADLYIDAVSADDGVVVSYTQG